MRTRNSLLWLGAGSLGVGFLVVLHAVLVRDVFAGEAAEGVIRATAVEIVDASGIAWIRLGVNDGAPQIEIGKPSSTSSIRLRINERGVPFLQLVGPDRRGAIDMYVSADGAMVALAGKTSEPRLNLKADFLGTTGFAITDKDSQILADIAFGDLAQGVLLRLADGTFRNTVEIDTTASKDSSPSIQLNRKGAKPLILTPVE